MNVSANLTDDSSGNGTSRAVDSSLVLWRIGSPFLLALGTVGNTLAIYFLHRMKYPSSFHVFLMAMAVCDLLALFVEFVWTWIDAHPDTSACRVLRWCNNSLGMLSVWLLAAMVVQRALYEFWPNLSATTNIRRQTHIIIATLVIALFAANTYELVDLPGDGSTQCGWSDHMDQNNLYELTWFNLVFFSLLPTTIILVGDLFLVKAVSKNAAQVGLSSVSTSFSVPPPLEETRSQHSSVSTGFSSSATDFDVKVYEVTSAEKQAYDSYERYGCRCCYLFADSMKRVLTVDPLSGDWFAAIRGTGKTVSPAKSTGTSTRRTTQTYGQFECMRRRACPQTTVSLMALTLMFLVLTPPLTVQTLRVERNPELGRQEEFRFYITLALLAWYANHAVKFYLMFLTGSVFKEQLKKILRVKEKKSSYRQTDPHTTMQKATIGIRITHVSSLARMQQETDECQQLSGYMLV